MVHNKMKNQTQRAKSIEDVLAKIKQAIFNTKTHHMKSSIAPTCESGKGRAIELHNTPNIFLVQNKGKGPPGKRGSPTQTLPEGEGFKDGAGIKGFTLINLLPEASPLWRRFVGSFLTNKTYNDYKFYKFSFIQLLNSIIMKKQLFILILAVFAFSAAAFGQVVMPASTRAPKVPVSCTTADDSPLNPKPGKSYEYGVNIGNTGAIGTEQVKNYFWWATKNPDFVTTGSNPNTANMLDTSNGLIATGPGYAQTTGGTGSMTITWSPSILAGTQYQGTPGNNPSPTFVAVMAQGACANNIQVFEINPQPAFTVDITNIATASTTAELYGNTISSCVSDVVSATYSTGTVHMDYGVNTIYFEVISANFVGSWTPTITVTGLATGETASVTIYKDWGDAKAGINGQETLNYAADGSQVGTVALGATTTLTDTSGGVSIWLGVTIDHNNYENTTVRPITVAVGGMDTMGTYDLVDNCSIASNVDTDDNATQDITPRPDIIDTTGDPANPVPGTFIPKN